MTKQISGTQLAIILGLTTAMASAVGCQGADSDPTASPGADATPTPSDEASPTPTFEQDSDKVLSIDIASNPGCDLSAVLTWTTSEPASSWVEFGEGGLTHRIGSDTLTTDHEVVVLGMYAETSFDIRAVSVTESGDTLVSRTQDYTTGDLPYSWMETEVDVLIADSERGWTLYNAAIDNMDTPVVLQMLNEDGKTIWYYAHEGDSGRLDAQVSWVDGEVLFGPAVAQGETIFRTDLTGEIVWEGPVQEGDRLDEDGTFHHVTESLSNGDILTVRLERETVSGTSVSSDTLIQYDANSDEVWSWAAIEHTDVLPLDVDSLDQNGDWLHINSAAVDLENDAVYFSSLKLKKVVKVNRTTGEVEWMLGDGGDFEADPSVDEPWFTSLHAMEYLGDSRFILYDNGDASRRSSRAMIYQLDENTMEATVEWTFSGDGDTFYNNVGGDADLLNSGNVLVVGGSGMSGSTDTRLMEVNENGDLVWQVWPYQGSTTVSVFQADRIEALAELID